MRAARSCSQGGVWPQAILRVSGPAAGAREAPPPTQLRASPAHNAQCAVFLSVLVKAGRAGKLARPFAK